MGEHEVTDTRNDTQRATRHAPTPRRKRSGATPEAKVAAKVNAYLDAITRVNLRTGAGAVRAEGRYITIGQKGTSDRTVCLRGRFVAVETKATTDLTPDQIAYRDKVLEEGGIYITAYNVDDLRAGLAAAFGAAQLAAWDAMQKRGRR